MNSYVITFIGLKEEECFKIVKGATPEHAVGNMQRRFHRKREILDVRLFSGIDNIPHYMRKSVEQELYLATKAAEKARMAKMIKEEMERWPKGYVPDSPIRYLMAVFIVGAK